MRPGQPCEAYRQRYAVRGLQSRDGRIPPVDAAHRQQRRSSSDASGRHLPELRGASTASKSERPLSKPHAKCRCARDGHRNARASSAAARTIIRSSASTRLQSHCWATMPVAWSTVELRMQFSRLGRPHTSAGLPRFGRNYPWTTRRDENPECVHSREPARSRTSPPQGPAWLRRDARFA